MVSLRCEPSCGLTDRQSEQSSCHRCHKCEVSHLCASLCEWSNGPGSERLPTGSADEGFLTHMDPHVEGQVAALAEHFTACSAGVRLQSGVGSHVDQQVVVLDETFPTGVTGERSLTCMDFSMSSHVMALCKKLSTDVTFQRILSVSARSWTFLILGLMSSRVLRKELVPT